MDVLAPAAALMLLVTKTVEWARQFVPHALTGKVLIPVSMGVATLFVFLFGASPVLAGKIPMWDGTTLAQADVWSKLVWGLCIGAGSGTVFDLAKRPTMPSDDETAEH